MSVFADTVSLALIAGVVAPPFIAVLQQPWFTPRVRASITLVVSLVVGVLVAVSQGVTFNDPVTLLAAAAAVLIAANNTYRSLWSKIGTTGFIESLTSPTRDDDDGPPPGEHRRTD